jgi:feruloyl-CoA synthase
MSAPKFRPLTFGVTRVKLRDGAPGVHYLSAEQPLQDYPARITDRLQHWAQVARSWRGARSWPMAAPATGGM